MNHRVYKIINTYLSEVLFSELREIKTRFTGNDVRCWKSKDDVVIMIEFNEIKLSGKIWYILTNHFSLSVSDIHMIMVGWIKGNLGINRTLVMGECSYTRSM